LLSHRDEATPPPSPGEHDATVDGVIAADYWPVTSYCAVILHRRTEWMYRR